MVRFMRVWVLGGVVALALSSGAFAQPADDPPKDAKPAGERLTMESLKAMLEGLGYEDIRELTDKEGKVVAYEVMRLDDTWVFYGRFELSRDQSHLWVSLAGPKIDAAAALRSLRCASGSIRRFTSTVTRGSSASVIAHRLHW